MLYGLYLSAMGLQAQETRQNVMANNLANAQTTGFKRDLALTRSRLNPDQEDPMLAPFRIPVYGDQGGGTRAVSGGIDLTQGDLESTGEPTDLALKGGGFFTVAGDKPGEKLLTRDGRFLIDQNENLVTADGRSVLSANGEPIKLRPNDKILVDSSGVIHQGDDTVEMGIVDVKTGRDLRKLGGNLLTADAKNILSKNDQTIVQQGYLEASGVDPVVEMVNMLAGQRAFDANARMISYQDQTLAQLNNVGRIA